MAASLTVFEDAEALASAAAERVAALARAAVDARGRFVVALSGGSTPERMHARLATLPVPWAQTFVFFGDERLVARSDPRSNAGMARRTLLERVPIPPSQVFVVPTDRTAARAAAQYEATLDAFFHGPPRFDLILLGLGDDGHTASLFPGRPALHCTDRRVIDTPPGVLPPPVERVTLTFPSLNNARHLLFLVAGAKKAGPLAAWREGRGTLETLPASGVLPREGVLEIFADQEAVGFVRTDPSSPLSSTGGDE